MSLNGDDHENCEHAGAGQLSGGYISLGHSKAVYLCRLNETLS